jgi:aminopeptidase C
VAPSDVLGPRMVRDHAGAFSRITVWRMRAGQSSVYFGCHSNWLMMRR